MQDKHLQFSVIIPTHNRNDLLLIAIKSALNQGDKPLQIIIIDDVPSENTEKLVKNIVHDSDTEILYFKNLEKKGALRSRNIGARYAKGNYLAFLDDDDYWNENYLKRVAEVITKNNMDIAVAKVVKFNNKGQFKEGKIPPDIFNIKDYYLENPGILCSNFVVARDKFLQVDGYDEYVLGSADKDLFIKLKRIGCRHYVLKEDLVFWRVQHADQWSLDKRRVLPSVIRFYKKYFWEMGVIYHLKMIKKIIRFYFLSKKMSIDKRLKMISQ